MNGEYGWSLHLIFPPVRRHDTGSVRDRFSQPLFGQFLPIRQTVPWSSVPNGADRILSPLSLLSCPLPTLAESNATFYIGMLLLVDDRATTGVSIAIRFPGTFSVLHLYCIFIEATFVSPTERPRNRALEIVKRQDEYALRRYRQDFLQRLQVSGSWINETGDNRLNVGDRGNSVGQL